jgi:polyamine oxidase
VLFREESWLPAAWMVDLDAFGAGPTLVCHLFHSAVASLPDDSVETALAWVTAQLAGILGRPCPRPVAGMRTDWAGDPFARGSYSHVPPGAANHDLDLLGSPLDGRLLFAGEHTQAARMGFADGAMTSGIREAKRLLQVPRVTGVSPSSSDRRSTHG